MKNTDTLLNPSDTPGAQQLTLLAVPESADRTLQPSGVHARFRLSRSTRERGLAHVAEIRAQLAASKAAREAENVVALPTRSHRAA